MLMGQREYARHRGCALRSVQKAIEKGRIQVIKDESGRIGIDPDVADRAWLLNTDPARRSVLFGAGPSQEAGAGDSQDESGDEDPSSDEVGDADDDENSRAFLEARAAREQVRLERDRLELDIARGKYLLLDDAKRIAFTFTRGLRDALGHVGTRVKDACAVETDPLSIEKLIDSEVNAVLDVFDARKALRETDEDDESG